MATKILHVKLEGKSQLHEPIVKLEGILINIWSIDGGLTWENKNVILDINGNLEIYMSCKAMTGTGWSFYVKEKNGATKYENEGRTGEALESRDGARISNFSERIASVHY